MKHLLLNIFLALFFASISGFSQNKKQLTSNDVEAKFVKHKIEVEGHKTFFNVLKVTNKTSKVVDVNVIYTLPDNWTLIGVNEISLSLSPNSTKSLPVRVSASREVKGDIGYVVVAAVSDFEGNNLVNEYCFITVPRKSNVKTSVKKRILYFDQKTQTADFEVKIENKGNINEIISLDMNLDKSLEMSGAKEYFFTDDISLEANKDTTINFSIKIKNLDDNRNLLNKVRFTARNQDKTLYNTTIWAKYLPEKFSYQIPENKKCCIVELYAHDILSKNDPIYSLQVSGNVLLKKNRDIYYFYRNADIRNENNQDWMKNSRMYLGFRQKNLEIQVGDVGGSGFQMASMGKGINAKYEIAKTAFRLFATKGIYRDAFSLGGAIGRDFSFANVEIGSAFVDEKEWKIKNNIYFINSGFSINKHHRIQTVFSLTSSKSTDESFENREGFGGRIAYSANYKKLKINALSEFSSKNYQGNTKGKTNVKVDATYQLKNNQLLSGNYTINRYSPTIYLGDSILPERYTQFERYNLQYGINLLPKVYTYIGSEFIQEKANTFYTYSPEDFFASQSGIFTVGARIRGEGTQNTINPSFSYGFTKITDFATNLNENYTPEITASPDFSIARFSLNIRRKYWGLYLNYYYGAYNIQQQYSYFYSDYLVKSLSIMPYYDRFITKNMRLSVRANFSNNFTSKTSRFNLSNQLQWYLKGGWSFHLRNTINVQSNIDRETGALYNYPSSYTEVGIRKEFDCNQPRIRFHDIKIFFFKDINGNRKKDDNEPGIRNILVGFDRDFIANEKYNPDYDGEFTPTELLTGQEGMVMYEKIPESIYRIDYITLGKGDKHFSAEENSQNIHIKEDKTLWIPFMEKNKVFGRLVFKRSKFSKFGDMNIANVKITATDTRGKSYSTLTDKKGNFVLYVPNTDQYIVKVNNIFHKHFTIHQEEFIVKFNGYRQFEIAFIFNEKARKVIFNKGKKKNKKRKH